MTWLLHIPLNWLRINRQRILAFCFPAGPAKVNQEPVPYFGFYVTSFIGLFINIRRNCLVDGLPIFVGDVTDICTIQYVIFSRAKTSRQICKQQNDEKFWRSDWRHTVLAFHNTKRTYWLTSGYCPSKLIRLWLASVRPKRAAPSPSISASLVIAHWIDQ